MRLQNKAQPTDREMGSGTHHQPATALFPQPSPPDPRRRRSSSGAVCWKPWTTRGWLLFLLHHMFHLLILTIELAAIAYVKLRS